MIAVNLTPWQGHKILGVILVGIFEPPAGFLEHPMDEIIGLLQDYLRWGDREAIRHPSR